MPWNPEVYSIFKKERFAPFHDLISFIDKKPGMQAIDLGCGTGEMTEMLAEALPGSDVLGIDSSAEMLAASAQFTSPQVRFLQRTIQDQLAIRDTFDLVFSNAALQWVEDHEALIPHVAGIVKAGGQVAIQMPDQHRNILNQILLELSGTGPFHTALDGWQRQSPVLTLDRYSEILFRNGGKNIIALEKIYPVVVDSPEQLISWVAGTTLRPYLEKLPQSLHLEFEALFKQRIAAEFPLTPIFYPFRRIILVATF